MGQYYKLCNLDAQQMLNPHDFGDGVKLMEFGLSGYGTLSALAAMLVMGKTDKGPWAGHRVVVTGDYADEGRFVPPEFGNMNLYSYAQGAPKDEADESEEEPAARFPLVPAMVPQERLNAMGIDLDLRKGGYNTVNRIPALFTEVTLDQPEDFFLAFDANPSENLVGVMENVAMSLRCGNIKSDFAWATLKEVKMTTDKETGKATSLKMKFQDRNDTYAAPVSRTLNFPATTQDIKRFLGTPSKLD